MARKLLRRNLPLVAVVGRPNVGKSTLFNRLTGKHKAVVHDTPGLTRDRNYLAAEWEGRDFMMIDTGGYEIEDEAEIYRQMREQLLLAVEEAHVIILLTDLTEPDNPVDDEVMQKLRKSGKPVILAVNKCDTRQRRDQAALEFARFGAGTLVGVSALHGSGTDELLDAVLEKLPPPPAEGDDSSDGIRIAVVGKPNVGKSTLVNKILGYERVIANPLPGTTRDSIDTTFERDGQIYTLIDTAGIRRRGKVERGVEKLSVLSSMISMEQCDVALILIDAIAGLTEQDAHVAGHAVDSGCAVVLVVNKWDAYADKTHKSVDEFTQQLRDEWGFLKDAPVIFISALTGQRVEKLFDVINELYAQYTKEIETTKLNDWLQRTVKHVSPPVRSGKQLKIKYGTQTGTKPPTFAFFVNDPKLVHFSYKRYLLNQLRREFGFSGVPVKFRFRQKAEAAPKRGRPYQK
ncbi:MAG: ribosome biogenesis GTPase Der [Candidatus Sumerlaeaceae bacterium]